MTTDRVEMHGLYRHIMLDASRRNRGWIATILAISCLVTLLPTDTNGSFSFFETIRFCFVFFLIPQFELDNRILICLPISQWSRGKCHWLSYIVPSLLGFVPLIAIGVVLMPEDGYIVTALLTAAAAFPLTSLTFRRRAHKVSATSLWQTTSLALLILFALTQYVNYILYCRLDFPWLFLVLLPLAVGATLWSYPHAHLLGRFPLQLSAEPPQPLEETSKMPGHPHILYTAVATPAVEGVTTILLLFLFMKIWDWDQDMLLIASVIPCIMTFSRLVDLLRSNLRLLRSLPLSRDCLAIIVMGCALASICIQVAAIALLRTLTLGFLPGLPVNFILLWMCPFAFFPFIAVFGRKWAALFVLPLFLAPAAIWTSLTESSTLQEYLALTPAPWFVLSSAICLIAAFFLLRYALLRPRLDWRYMREVQEMTARGSAT